MKSTYLLLVTLALSACALAQQSPSPPATVASPPYRPSEGKPTDSPQAFSCAEKKLDLTRDQLEQIAFEEFEKRGGRVDRSRMETRIVNKGCDWQVLVILLPRAPGAHFGVLIDGVSGKVKNYFSGS